jgi:hypothetical protein
MLNLVFGTSTVRLVRIDDMGQAYSTYLETRNVYIILVENIFGRNHI